MICIYKHITIIYQYIRCFNYYSSILACKTIWLENLNKYYNKDYDYYQVRKHITQVSSFNFINKKRLHLCLQLVPYWSTVFDWRHMSELKLYLLNCKFCEIVFSFVLQFINNKNLTLGFLNPGSLGTRHNEFLAALMRHDVDIMAINETWLRAGEEKRAPAPPGYRLRHVPRDAAAAGARSRGGGVGMYLRCGVTARRLQHPPAPSVEQMWLGFNINGLRVALGTAYRPPWLNVDTFLDALSDSITSFAIHDYIVLLGDFNINLLNKQESSSKKLLGFLHYMHLTQYVQHPTHFTEYSETETLIDVICCNKPVSNVTVDHIPDLSSHAFLTCQLNIKKYKPAPKIIWYRPIKDINLIDFNNMINSIIWEELRMGCVNDMVTKFNDCILNIFEIYAPLKSVYIKERTYPWITSNIKEMMRLRDEAHAKYRRTKLDSHKKYYKDLKSLVNVSLYHEQAAYYQQHINANINNPRKLWKNIKNNLVDFKEKDTELPPHLADPSLINSHFLDIPGNNNVDQSYISYLESNRFGTSIFNLRPVSMTTIANIIKSITTNASGIDGISLDMVLLTLPGTLSLITSIVNESLHTGVFPELWKIATVRPIPKVTHPVSFKDLRPISILPFMSKIIEKVVCIQLIEYLEGSQILPVRQSGFRKGHSTASALLDVVDEILTSQDEGKGTILALLDFTRAFDSINTTILLSKLTFYGFSNSALKWFASYLTDRSQLVEIRAPDGSSARSETLPLSRGVPQGSILGPVLYSIYSANIVDNIKHCKFHIYADDLQLFISFKPGDTQEAVGKLNEDLSRIAEWSKINSLVLNPTKSKFLVVGSKKRVNQIINFDPQVYIDGQNLEHVPEARNLGLLMDGALHFENHVLETARNCFYRLKVLYKARDYLSVDLRVKLCDSLILSKLNYSDVVYGNCLLARTKKVIQRVQNACARFCFPIPPRSHITPYLNNNKLLNMDARRRLHFATLLFGIIKFKQPKYLFEKLTISKRPIRGDFRLIFPRHSTAAFRGSFRYAATKCWNNLPPPIKECNSVACFKQKLKKYLLDEQSAAASM